MSQGLLKQSERLPHPAQIQRRRLSCKDTLNVGKVGEEARGPAGNPWFRSSLLYQRITSDSPSVTTSAEEARETTFRPGL